MSYSGRMSTGGSGNVVAKVLGGMAAGYAAQALGRAKEPSMADKDLYARRRYEEQHHAAEQAHRHNNERITHTAETLKGLNPDREVIRGNIDAHGGSAQFGDKKPVASSKDNSSNPEHKGSRKANNPAIRGPRQFQNVTRKRPGTAPARPGGNTPADRRRARASRKPAGAPYTPLKAPKAPTPKKTTTKEAPKSSKTPKATEIPKYTGPSVYRNPKTNKIEAHPDLVAHRKKYGIKAPAKKKK